MAGRDLLELACGTGYWTALIARRARSVLATDVAGEVLDVARRKDYPAGRVTFAQADAYRLDLPPRPFNGAVAGFWWSHVPRRKLPAFLAGLGRRLQPGARVVFFDNRYVPGESIPISRRAGGNTYQRRRLDDGSEHEVIKNFPELAELHAAAAPYADGAAAIALRYFWLLTYLSAPAARRAATNRGPRRAPI